MLNENTILVTSGFGPYIAVAVSGDKEEIESTLTPLYNYGAFDGEVQYKSDNFGYITGPKGRFEKGLRDYFVSQEVAAHLRSGGGKNHGLKKEGVRKANKVLAAQVRENFMVDLTAKKEYSFPEFDYGTKD